MIAEGMALDDLRTDAFQRIEELAGAADSRKGDNALAGESAIGDQACATDSSAKSGEGRIPLTHEYNRIRAGKTPLDRFAQRTCRDDPAIAESEVAVDHDDRKILRNVEILMPVIHHDDTRAL